MEALNFTIDFYHTIHLPSYVFQILDGFHVKVSLLANQPNLPMHLDPAFLGSIDRDILHLRDFSVHVAERAASIHPTDPLLTTDGMIAKYENLVKLQSSAENTFHNVQTSISNMNHRISSNPNFLLERACRNIDRDTDRLRLGINTLTRSIRLMEGAIRDKNPNYGFLREQWYEN